MRRSRGLARGLAAGAAVLGLVVLTSCSDSEPDSAPSPVSSTSASSTTPSSGPIPTASTPTLTPLPTPTKPWPTPKIPGKPPEPESPLGDKIVFEIAAEAQIRAGKVAKTTVKCPGIDKVEEPGQHKLTCTVTYAGKSYTGTLIVNPERYNGPFTFTSDMVAIVKEKVVDAVLRKAPDAAKVTCTMDDVAVVNHSGEGIACDVTTTANAVQPYKVQVSGDGLVSASKA